MPESQTHRRGKGSAARQEVHIRGAKRLDAIRGHYAIEVERSGSEIGITKALSPLRTQRNKAKILRVPQHDMDTAVDVARQKGINVTVTNLAKTKRKKA